MTKVLKELTRRQADVFMHKLSAQPVAKRKQMLEDAGLQLVRVVTHRLKPDVVKKFQSGRSFYKQIGT
jgi:predicted urease superfamily metal-dependent hydrolase